MKSTTKPNDTKKKILIVVLLVTLLLAVVWQNLTTSSSATTVGAVDPLSPVSAKPKGPLTGAAALAALEQRLPKIDLDQVLAHDPFQMVASTSSEDLDANLPSTLDSNITADASVEPDSDSPVPQTLMVTAILHGGPRPAIMIGQQVYYEQDQVDDQWRILAIHPDRVTVERIDDAP
jgi:hypothetical protein